MKKSIEILKPYTSAIVSDKMSLMRSPSERTLRALRFFAAGVAGFLINLGVYSLLIYKAGLWYVLASVVAFLVALNFSFVAQKRFAFRDRNFTHTPRQFVLYLLCILFNMTANAGLLYVCVEVLEIGKIIALVLSNAVIALWSFFLYEQIIFVRRAGKTAPAPVSVNDARPFSVSVVIPCHNEEDSIRSVIEGLPKDVHEIIVVDNNSTDRTAEIARSLGARVVPEEEKGYGAALQTGFRAARGDIIAALDGDNQYPGYEIPAILAFMTAEGLDFVSAARFPLKHKGSMSSLRRVGNWGLTFAANATFDLGLSDSQTGMWVFKRSIFEVITVRHKDMPLSQELKIKAAVHPDIRFAEYRIPYHPRIGESKLSPFKHGIILLWNLVVLRIELR